MKAVFVETPGGVENLKYAEIPTPTPGPGQALVKIAAAGVNFIDVYFRTGLYPAPPPIVLGNEGAGTVEAVGPGVTNVAPGDRVAYAMARGSYAEYAVVPAWQLVKIPASVEMRSLVQLSSSKITGRSSGLDTRSRIPATGYRLGTSRQVSANGSCVSGGISSSRRAARRATAAPDKGRPSRRLS